jgi:DeoR/GlpR family transcriptional regulator of sugar metabolism
MTTNPTKPQRVRIAEYIADNAKCTAINIANALKISDTTVANELNTLRTEGVIDCERSGKPPALRYFPTVETADLMDAAEHGAADAIDLPSGIQPGSRKAQIWHALRGGKRLSTRQLSDTLHLKPNTIDPTVLEMFKAALLDRTKGFNNV